MHVHLRDIECRSIAENISRLIMTTSRKWRKRRRRRRRNDDASDSPLAGRCRTPRGTLACALSAECRPGWWSCCAVKIGFPDDGGSGTQRANGSACCPQRRASSGCDRTRATRHPGTSTRSRWSAATRAGWGPCNRAIRQTRTYGVRWVIKGVKCAVPSFRFIIFNYCLD